MIHGHAQLFGDSIESQVVGIDNGGFTFKYPAFMAFPQPASFFRRSLIEQSGLLDDTLHYGMDFDLVVRAFLIGEITYYPNLFSRYRIHSSSKTNHSSSFVSDWRIVFSRFVNTYPIFSDWRNLLIAHQLHSGTNDSYVCDRYISEDEFQFILYTHLFTSAHMLYQSGDGIGARHCIQFLQHYLPHLCHSRDLNQLQWRSYIPLSLRNFYHCYFK
jgi:hypothetical protein